jgi:4-amino-4-deoxy-L-arabinose transferase-like glycosyltransferase
VPRFTDEQLDVLYTLPLYRQQAIPLVGFDPYNGAMFSYMLAALLWLIGPQPYAPRLLVLLTGSATVAATYLLGREINGRLAGLIAAGLLATSATHVLVNSHVAWSNSTTPLFSTLGFAMLMPAITRGSGLRLAVGALGFAFALQTHPSILGFLPGIGLALLWRQPRLVLGRWSLIASLFFLVGYAPVIIHNLPGRAPDPYRIAANETVPDWRSSNDQTYPRLIQQQQTYAAGQHGPDFLQANFGALSLNLPRIAASIIDERPAWSDYLTDPSYWVFALVIVLGLVWPLGRANPLPLLSAATFLCALVLLNGRYEPIFSGRYLMPLLPLAYGGFGALVADLWSEISGRLPRLAMACLLALLISYPLFPLVRYLQRNGQEGQINIDLIQTAATLENARRAHEPLFLDEALGRRGLPGDGDLLMSLQVFLELRNVPYEIGSVAASKLDGTLGDARVALVVFALPYERELEARFRFIPIDDRSGGRYAAYRIERR